MFETDLLWLLAGLALKHFIADFPLQAFPYQYRNKGTYGHLGGVLHSSIHSIGTLLVFLLAGFGIEVALWLALVDGLIHYHIDWAKMQINRRTGWGPTTHEQFWVLLGLDQLLHSLTYLGLVAYATN